jgi:hypothetical protein
MSVVDVSFDHPMKLEEKASAPLAGGIMSHGFQCGMLWGASLAAGAEAYRRMGPSPLAETRAIVATQRAMDSFKDHTKNEIDCSEISHMDLRGDTPGRSVLKFLGKGGPLYCFWLAAKYAPGAFSEIGSSLSEESIEAPAPPVSCAATLARKIGVSDKHAVMAAGLAGGIGLSGGACGALGAAIWIIAMNSLEAGAGELDLNNPEALAAIDAFVESSDYEFECSDIVGRSFADVSDHAGYVRAGGCSEIIEALASYVAGVEFSNGESQKA